MNECTCLGYTRRVHVITSSLEVNTAESDQISMGLSSLLPLNPRGGGGTLKWA